MEPVSDGHAGKTFAQALESLKREGSTILVVGAGVSDAHEAICHRLLGAEASDQRHRLVVSAPDATYRGEGCVCERPDQSTRLIEHDHPVTAPSPGPEGNDHDQTPRGGDHPVGSFGADIVEAVRDLEESAGGLEPSELRVCVDSIVALLSEYETEAVFKLVHLTSTSVKQVRGMAHYHLPLERDHEAVHLLEPLFDAVVEVRIREGHPQQRWHLRDQQTTSEWLEL